jgi:hypothetical protein
MEASTMQTVFISDSDMPTVENADKIRPKSTRALCFSSFCGAKRNQYFFLFFFFTSQLKNVINSSGIVLFVYLLHRCEKNILFRGRDLI